jgi:carbon storage regulator
MVHGTALLGSPVQLSTSFQVWREVDMLVLTRKVGEEIVIGTNIRITVVAIKGEKVRLGIAAPKEVVVDRGEVHESRKSFFDEELSLTPVPISLSDDLPFHALPK